jgi:heme oxygenase
MTPTEGSPLLPPESPLSELRRATRFHQCVADADRFALVGKPPSLPAYVQYLGKLYGFEAPLESALNIAPGLSSRIDLARRMKSPVIGMELCALGFPASRILELPQCTFSPFQTLAEALGWLFVSEVNRSGHHLFRTYFAHELPAAAESSGAYIARTNSTEWEQLGAVLDEVCAVDPATLDGAIDAAIRGFDYGHMWLRPGTPSGTYMQNAQRIAEERLRRLTPTGEAVVRF